MKVLLFLTKKVVAVVVFAAMFVSRESVPHWIGDAIRSAPSITVFSLYKNQGMLTRLGTVKSAF